MCCIHSNAEGIVKWRAVYTVMLKIESNVGLCTQSCSRYSQMAGCVHSNAEDTVKCRAVYTVMLKIQSNVGLCTQSC